MTSFVIEFPWTLNLLITSIPVKCTLHCSGVLKNSLPEGVSSFPKPIIAYLLQGPLPESHWVALFGVSSSLANNSHSTLFVSLLLQISIFG